MAGRIGGRYKNRAEFEEFDKRELTPEQWEMASEFLLKDDGAYFRYFVRMGTPPMCRGGRYYSADRVDAETSGMWHVFRCAKKWDKSVAKFPTYAGKCVMFAVKNFWRELQQKRAVLPLPTGGDPPPEWYAAADRDTGKDTTLPLETALLLERLRRVRHGQTYARVIMLHYGIGGPPHTYVEIGAMLEKPVSRGRVEQLLQLALGHLRNFTKATRAELIH